MKDGVKYKKKRKREKGEYEREFESEAKAVLYRCRPRVERGEKEEIEREGEDGPVMLNFKSCAPAKANVSTFKNSLRGVRFVGRGEGD